MVNATGNPAGAHLGTTTGPRLVLRTQPRLRFRGLLAGGSKMRPSRGLIDNALKHRDAQLSFFKSILIVFRSLSDPPGAMDLE